MERLLLQNTNNGGSMVTMTSEQVVCKKTVAKFGGSSLCDSIQFRKVKAIVECQEERCCIVVSAPGKRFDDDIKVTDLLIQLYDMQQEKLNRFNEYELEKIPS